MDWREYRKLEALDDIKREIKGLKREKRINRVQMDIKDIIKDNKYSIIIQCLEPYFDRYYLGINLAVPNKKDLDCECCDKNTMLYDIMLNHGNSHVCRFVLNNSINTNAIIRKINTYYNNRIQLYKFAVDNNVDVSYLNIIDYNDKKIIDEYIANKNWWNKAKWIGSGIIVVGYLFLLTRR